MDFSQHFNSEALSDVILHVRTTVDNITENTSFLRSRSSEISNARSFYLHKVILFQSPYFQKLQNWKKRDQAAVDASSGNK